MRPRPVWGLIRSPAEISGMPGSAVSSASRSSSSRLSALTWTPSRTASRSSSLVLAGESNTMRSGGTPAARASRSSGREATSAPAPRLASSAISGGKGLALTATAVRVVGGKAAPRAVKPASRASRSWMMIAVSVFRKNPEARASRTSSIVFSQKMPGGVVSA